MLYIRNEKDAKKSMTEEMHLEFLRKCESYIRMLKCQNKLISAQPLVAEGVIITRNGKGWVQKTVMNQPEVQVGYYHIYAKDYNDAVKTAMQNPEFEYIPSASIEIRPVLTKEPATHFEYPAHN